MCRFCNVKDMILISFNAIFIEPLTFNAILKLYVSLVLFFFQSTHETIYDILIAEVKLKKEHAASSQPPLVQPITPQVLEQMERKPPSLDDVKVVNTTTTTMSTKS